MTENQTLAALFVLASLLILWSVLGLVRIYTNMED